MEQPQKMPKPSSTICGFCSGLLKEKTCEMIFSLTLLSSAMGKLLRKNNLIILGGHMKEIVKRVKLLECVDVDNIAIRRDQYFSNAYVIDLPLDSVPDHVWQDIAEREWKSSRHLWDRKLFVVGDKLRLVTTIDNIEDKVDWVRYIVERTNGAIDEYNREVEADESKEEEEPESHVFEEDRANVETIREIMRKRFGTL